MSDMVYLKAPNGVVIGMTLPLHETIEQQWQRGELQQVSEDGSPLDEEVGEPSSESTEPEAPARPRDNAHKREWQAYAVALGAAAPDEAASLTRAQLIELTTPPEMTPVDQEV